MASDLEGVKLTKRQTEFLRECWANRRDHGTGTGGKVWDNHDALVANNLQRMGLISQPPMYTIYLGAHLTEAGRKAIATLRAKAATP